MNQSSSLSSSDLFSGSSLPSIHSHPFTNDNHEFEPAQITNFDAFMLLLNNRQALSDLTWQIEGRTTFQSLMMVDHIHSTIRHLEREIKRQRYRGILLVDHIIKDKKLKKLRWYFNQNRTIKLQNKRYRKHTPPMSPNSSSSSSNYQSISPEPLPIPPPGSASNPIVISDDNEEFPTRNFRQSIPVTNDIEDEIDWTPVVPCGNCGSTTHVARSCRTGLIQDPETKFWYHEEFLTSEDRRRFSQVETTWPLLGGSVMNTDYWLSDWILYNVTILFFSLFTYDYLFIDFHTRLDAAPWWLRSSSLYYFTTTCRLYTQPHRLMDNLRPT
jgi:hypothetical protein